MDYHYIYNEYKFFKCFHVYYSLQVDLLEGFGVPS